MLRFWFHAETIDVVTAMFTLAHVLWTKSHPRTPAPRIRHHTPIDVTAGALAASFQTFAPHELFERGFVGDFVTVGFAISLGFFVRPEMIVSRLGPTMEN